MSFIPETARCLLSWLTLVTLLSGCQSVPVAGISIPPTSSLLAVDVLFPSPLGRDHSLVQVFFVRGPIGSGSEELPELLPASFVKKGRAYLLDPEPGSYSLVAVGSELAPPWNRQPVAGVTRTVANERLGHVSVFPAELIGRTGTTVRPGEVAFMGVLRVRRSDRIKANAVLQDDLQKRLAERIRPGATTKSGLAGSLSMTWMVDLAETSLSNDAADREFFFEAALTDLGVSPWAQVIARAAPPKVTTARAPKPAPRETTAAGARTPEPAAAPAARVRRPAPRDTTAPGSRTPEPRKATAEKVPQPALREAAGSPSSERPDTAAVNAPQPAPREATAADPPSSEPPDAAAVNAPELAPREATAADSSSSEPPDTAAVKAPEPAPSGSTAADPPSSEPLDATAVKAPAPAPRDVTAAGSRTPEPDLNDTSPNPVTLASIPQGAAPSSEPTAPESGEAPPAAELPVIAGIPPDSPLAKIEIGMHHADVRKILGDPDERIERQTAKAWIPFYEGPGGRLTDWVYDGVGRVVFSQHTGLLLVFDAVHEPNEQR